MIEKEVSVPVEVILKNDHLLDQNSVRVSPEEVRLRGEVSKIEQIDRITVGPIDEKALRSDQTEQIVDLKLPDGVEGVEIMDNVDQATVFIEWPKETVATSFTVENIVVNGANGRDYELVTQSLRVSVRGLKNDIAKLTAGDIKAVVDLTAQDDSYPGSVKLPVQIVFPDDSVYELGEYEVEIIIGGES